MMNLIPYLSCKKFNSSNIYSLYCSNFIIYPGKKIFSVFNISRGDEQLYKGYDVCQEEMDFNGNLFISDEP